MSIEKNVQVVKDFFAAIGSGDKQRVLALVAEDIEWIVPGEDWPLAGTHRGHAGLADVLQKASEEVETTYPEPPEFVAQGDRVLVVGVATGKIKATNKAFKDDWVFDITVRNGKLTNIREYIDTQALARASEMDASPRPLVLSGEVEAFEARDGIEQILGTSGPRGFVGDVAMLNGTSAVASVRGKAEESEILEIPAAELRRALMELPGVSGPIVNAFIVRRQRLLRDREFVGLRVVATDGSRDGHLIHDFLDKNHIPHRLIQFESEDGWGLCERLKLASSDLPALITTAGVPMCKPSLREVAQVAGLLRPLADEGESEILCDLAIVGAGPAGLSAAVNAASEGLQTVVLESFAPGGQAGSSSLIENFFGFPTGISGGELTSRAQLQAFRFGAKFSTPAQVLSLAFSEGDHAAVLQIEGCNAKLRAKCVIIATGADYNRIDADGCASFEGRGVYYAATAIERQLCRKSTVIVAGGGNSAGQAAMFLSESTEKVLLVIRGADLSKSMSSYLSLRVRGEEKHRDSLSH
jgi:thioredoxin reductase (NADPH)